MLKITITETLKMHFLLAGGDFELAGGTKKLLKDVACGDILKFKLF